MGTDPRKLLDGAQVIVTRPERSGVAYDVRTSVMPQGMYPNKSAFYAMCRQVTQLEIGESIAAAARDERLEWCVAVADVRMPATGEPEFVLTEMHSSRMNGCVRCYIPLTLQGYASLCGVPIHELANSVSHIVTGAIMLLDRIQSASNVKPDVDEAINNILAFIDKDKEQK